MYRPLASTARRTPAPRRGALLIAVLGLLTLFAIFALFFVFYADNEAKSARIARDSEAVGEDGPPNDFAIAAFGQTLRGAIFDEFDSANGVLNPLRGHSVARTMYGWNGTTVGATAGAPFSGPGTFHQQTPQPSPFGGDRALWINHSTGFTPNVSGGPYTAGTTYWLDPEWSDFRLTAEVASSQLPGSIANRPSPGLTQTHVPKNAPYTYPDLKDLILASISPATGEVLVPSLHRNWLFNANNPNTQLRLAPWNPLDTGMATNTAQNTDWVTPEGRTRILRPRPVDQLRPEDFLFTTTVEPFDSIPTGPSPQYPFALPYSGGNLPPLQPGLAGYTGDKPNGLYNRIMQRIAQGRVIPYPPFNADGSYTGDVQNLMGSVGVQRNDSILIDIGMPPRKWNGKWIKPLASILLSDLDGLLNLNAHGNMRGGASSAPNWDRGFHTSYNGFGPHEVNLGAVLTAPGEAANVIQARYGSLYNAATQSFFSPIVAWQPGARYMTNQVVVNAGNFYICINSGPPPAPLGWQSGGAPGPTGSLPAPQAAPNDNQVIWQDVNIGLTRSGQGTLAFNRNGTRVPLYAPVNFDAGGNAPTYTPPTLPGAGGFQTSPQITSNGTPQSFYDDNVYDGSPDSYNKYLNHPLLYNTHDWTSGFARRRVFGMGDLKRFNTRYAADRDYYAQSDVAQSGVAPTGLIGSPGTFAGNSYRLDPAHFNRGLFTAFSSHLDRAHMPGNFNLSPPGGAGFFALPAGGQYHPANPAFQSTFAAGTGPDYNGPTDLRNPRALLGGIDLNRPLADYRIDTTQPLSPTNVVASPSQAWVDRHNLARDILGRLIVATGAQATVFTAPFTGGMPPVTYQTGDILINATVGTPEHNAIRYLAQLAANIVDLTDSDDISTPFSWETGPGWTTPRTITQVTTADIQGMIAQATAQTGGVVFGVEKPRLVINEAYGEITNEPGETFMGKANNPARVRFWVELMNPTSTPYATGPGATDPLGSGAVALRPAGFSPYQLQITQVRAGVNLTDLVNPTNTTGTLSTGGANESLTFDFSTAAGRTVLPVGSAANPYAPANGNPGILLVGPQPYNGGTTHPGPVEFSPNTGAAPWSGMVLGNAFGMGSTMEYALANMPPTTDLEDPTFMQKFRQHAVLLRRLANPYLAPAADNPYITVDVMNYVPAYDAVVRGGGAADTLDRTGKGGGANTTTPGYEDISNRYAVGKVQPYAGYSAQGAAGGGNNVTEIGAFPQSMVIRQNPNPLLAGEPQHTFFRMNGRSAVAAPAIQTTLPPPPATTAQAIALNNETIMAPFDWYVHFDRPLVNQIELLSLQATKPHEVTAYTILPPLAMGQPVRRGQGLAPWLGLNAAGQPGFDANDPRGLTNNGLYRALETLRVKPWMYGNAAGGKQHGRININMIQDERILQALLNPNNNTFLNTDVSLLWAGQQATMMQPIPIPGFITNAPGGAVPGSRTPNSIDRPVANGGAVRVPMPGPTIHDLPNPGAGLDRPFLSLGIGETTADPANSVPVARFGSGLQDTIFRVNTVTNSPTFGAPLLNVSGQTAPYMQAEMARKMFNNATTVSHAFAVTVTIVFHEVRMTGTTPDSNTTEIPGVPRWLIGKEAYKEIPGDLRQQFFAVVDRSSIGLQLPGTPQANQLIPQPLHAELAQPITIGQLAPSSPPMGFGFINPRPGSYNIYLANAVCNAPGPNPYTTAPGTFFDTVYVDGRPVIIQNGSFITIGIGVNQEPSTLMVNWVNQDGSLNVGDTTVPLPVPQRNHVQGELVSNFQTGNPGPNPILGVPFDPLNPTTPYRAVVPYAQRVR